jgi:uncharacterized coiled-coil protein SlyX
MKLGFAQAQVYYKQTLKNISDRKATLAQEILSHKTEIEKMDKQLPILSEYQKKANEKFHSTPNTSASTEAFRNPKVLTKDQMVRKIMTKLRKMTKPQLKHLSTKLNTSNPQTRKFARS